MTIKMKRMITVKNPKAIAIIFDSFVYPVNSPSVDRSIFLKRKSMLILIRARAIINKKSRNIGWISKNGFDTFWKLND